MEELTHQAAGRKKMLRDRAKRCVCKYCGSPLHLRQMVFGEFEEARVEIFCRNCGRIEFGVEPEIYESAKYFVDQTEFNYYPDMDDNEQTCRMNVAKVCEIMAWQDKMLGYLDEDGFTVAPQKTSFMGECLHLTDEDLDTIEAAESDTSEVASGSDLLADSNAAETPGAQPLAANA